MRRKYYRYKDSHRTVRGVKHKRCTICEKWKPESDFHKDRARTDGLKIRCKACDVVCQREFRRKKGPRVYLRFEERHRTVRGLKQKLCTGCKQWKAETGFHKSRKARDGLGLRCKQCANERARERLGAKSRDERKRLRHEACHRVVSGVRQKLCNKCGKWQKESDFYKNRAANDGLMARCRNCSYEAAGKSRKL